MRKERKQNKKMLRDGGRLMRVWEEKSKQLLRLCADMNLNVRERKLFRACLPLCALTACVFLGRLGRFLGRQTVMRGREGKDIVIALGTKSHC